eukprot:CAMPEP_0119048698 /NCGR_PEP_ID=MMETSP1177-20130426/60525_1 /TAXON_ID=2985 /ORGANISM="Ochromonas sp, Strain CCMP1899" /LENGTH=527 /DNA_ID=CAMNT_0007024965 /DNA_START=84 /DNA_END=1664 /DNA_ORIENTATION=+
MEIEKGHPSNFPGRVFVGADSLKGSYKSNAMLKGVDRQEVSNKSMDIQLLKKRGQLPESYDVHTSLQLTADRADTTDRSVVLNAVRGNFDELGYLRGRPLRKSIYYTDPYLTCSHCNSLSFVDGQALRNTLLFQSTEPNIVTNKNNNGNRNKVYNPLQLLKYGPKTKVLELEDGDVNGDSCSIRDNSRNEEDDASVRNTRSIVPYDNVAVEGRFPPVHIIHEDMPICWNCGKGNDFRVGVQDLSSEIEERKKAHIALVVLINAKARVIQLHYRKYCRMMYSSARWKRGLARRLWHYRGAAMINSYARMRLARRRIKTERWLVIIRTAIPSLLKWALKPSEYYFECFWYTRRDQLKWVYYNYIKLLMRTGFVPSRMQVESNIAEIGRRILERQSMLVVHIQRRWRGVMIRRIVELFRVECMLLLQKLLSKTMKIQRAFRGFYVRCVIIPEMMSGTRREDIMSAYLKDRKDLLKNRKKEDEKKLLKLHYIKERGLEAFARMTQRIEPASNHQGKKMKAWSSSMFCGKDD